MKIVANWKLLLKRAHSVRMAYLVVALSTADAILQGLEKVDLSMLPFSPETSSYIQITLTAAAALAGVGVAVARVLYQPMISGGGDGSST